MVQRLLEKQLELEASNAASALVSSLRLIDEVQKQLHGDMGTDEDKAVYDDSSRIAVMFSMSWRRERCVQLELELARHRPCKEMATVDSFHALPTPARNELLQQHGLF